jgi:tRNA pseudouridine13 synthase
MVLPDAAREVYIAAVTESAEALRDLQLSRLPFITPHIAAVSGRIKREPEDFEVEELPAYLPSGSGEHLYLWIEKRGRNTHDAARALAERLGAKLDDAGWAGLKDKHAVTRQWLSFHCPQTPEPAALELEGVRVLSVSRHANKLRTGHLRGNRFRLRLAEVEPGAEARIGEVLAHLESRGLPHYFGSQRFGHGGKNVPAAHAWLVEGRKAPDKPFLRKLFASALQAALFNAVLAERIERGLLGTALDGDVMRKEDTGGLFVSAEPDLDQARVDSWEISPTGPMFGPSMRAPERAALALETELCARWHLDPACFARARKLAEGTRRPLRVRPEQVRVERDGPDVVLQFALPRGAYATTLVAEITKSRDVTLAEDG